MIDFLRALLWMPPRPRRRTSYLTAEERYAELAYSPLAIPVHVPSTARKGIADIERFLAHQEKM